MFKWLYKNNKNRHNVSIIIPTFKNEKFLSECINSILNSSKKCCNFEILLGIDNCYDTLKFIENNSLELNKNIKIYFFSKNVGPYVIRNTLVQYAKYENIFFFDSDDIMMEETMDILLSRFSEKDILKFKFYNFEHAKGMYDIENLSISPILAHGVFLIKKNKFFQVGGFFPWRCGADTEFSERYEAIGNGIPKIDVPLFYRRYHENNITKSSDTSLESDERRKIRDIILAKRATKNWEAPKLPITFSCSLIKP